MTDLEVEYILSYVPMAKFKLDLNFDQIKKDILDMTKNVESVHKSNIGGWQSQSFSDVIRCEPVHMIFENYINSIMQDYSKNLGFNGKTYLSNYWLNVNYKDCFNVEHTHPASFLSGVFYIKCSEDSGNIEFLNLDYDLIEAYIYFNHKSDDCQIINDGDFSHFFKKTHELDISESSGYLFPSWRKHFVQKNKNDDSRISIAFNYNIDFGAKI